MALVNLRFLSEYDRLPPETVTGTPVREDSFVGINQDIKTGKAGKTDQKARNDPKGT